MLAIVSSTEGSINYASIGLRPHSVLSQLGRQFCEVEGSVDFVILYVPLDLGEVFTEGLAGLVEVLTGGHTLSVLRSPPMAADLHLRRPHIGFVDK